MPATVSIPWYSAAPIFACWVAFAAVWIGAWLHARRRSAPVRERAPFPTLLLVLMVAYVLTAVIVPAPLWNHLTFQPQRDVQFAAVLVVVLSTAFTIWARLALGTMWSLLAIGRTGHELRTTGPYAVTRHPIYTGILGMTTGTAIAVGGGICALALITVAIAILIKVRSEEELLVRIFGEQYRAYRRRVGAIIPVPKRRTG